MNYLQSKWFLFIPFWISANFGCLKNTNEEATSAAKSTEKAAAFTEALTPAVVSTELIPSTTIPQTPITLADTAPGAGAPITPPTGNDATNSSKAAAPVPGYSGTLSFTGATPTGFTVEWAAAVASSALSYAVYYSTTASDVGTLAAITATGSAAILGGSIKGGTSLALTELAAATTYNVNIVVSDEAGNQAIYLVGTVTTLPAPETQPPAPAPDAAVLSSNTQTQATPQAPASQIYMYSFQQGVTGNMGGRNGADALCVENKPAVCSKTSNIHAYLNVSSSDYISVDNFATAASEQPPSTGAIVTPDGKTQIAKSWSNLLTQGGCQSDNSTCYQKTTKASIGWIEGIFLWIGASTDQNCSGWTTDSSNATAGFTGFQSYMNRLYTAIGSTACNKSIHLLCICW